MKRLGCGGYYSCRLVQDRLHLLDGTPSITADIVAGSIGPTQLEATAVTSGSYTNTNPGWRGTGVLLRHRTAVADRKHYTAGEAIGAGDMVYVSASGNGDEGRRLTRWQSRSRICAFCNQ